VILDAPLALAMDTLRATEEAVRNWSNAISLLGSSGRAVIVGLTGFLAEKLSLWAQADISAMEFRSRSELRFPPSVRLASLGAEKHLISELLPVLQNLPGVEILGPVRVISKGLEIESKLLLKYEYSVGAELAKSLHVAVAKLSSGNSRSNLRTGKSMRPIRIKMDDFDVL
jgi:primosomal protein N' (replication factor Y)